MPATGDKAAAGSYACEHCEAITTLNEKDEALPYCPSCGIWTLYHKVDMETSKKEG